MPERRPLVAANWKMNKTIGETEAFLDSFLPGVGALGEVDVVVCPPYPSLGCAVEVCHPSGVEVAAQNMHAEADGAFTGEVSAAMLTDLGVDRVILGHSERRQLFGETDEELARKVPAAFDAGLDPILCVGETEDERDSGDTEEVLRRQLTADLADLDPARLSGLVIAYEPVWAIGTGRTATSDQAQEAIRFLRDLVGEISSDAAGAVRILYGGSVKADNAAELCGRADVDGALVGGASLDPEQFAAIALAAAGS